MQTAEYLAIIDDQLRSSLHDVAEHFGIQLENENQIFHDAKNDQVNEKIYRLYTGKKLQVAGFVEEYEPESIFLRFKGLTRANIEYLNELFER